MRVSRSAGPLAALALSLAALVPGAVAGVQAQDGAVPSPSPVPSPPLEASPAAAASPVPAASALPMMTGPEGTWDVLAFDAWGQGLAEPRTGERFTASLLTRGRLEGQTGCGDYHGGYSVEGERLGLGIVSKGFGECGRKRSEEAVAFSVALEAVTSWRATTDGLELLDETGAVRVELARPEFTDATGEWVVERYAAGQGREETPLAELPITLELGADGRLLGSSGCRFLEGAYTQEGTRILLGPIEPIGPACSGAARRQERRFFRLVELIAGWRRDADGLVLRDAQGAALLVLRAQVEAPPTSAAPTDAAATDAAATDAAASGAAAAASAAVAAIEPEA